MALFRRKARLLSFLIPFLLLIAFLSLTAGGYRRAPWYQQLLWNVVTPPQKILTSIGGAVSSVWNHYFALVGAEKENENLRMKVASLEGEIIKLSEVEKENERLQELLSYEKSFSHKSLTAKVIANDPRAEFKNITINKGHDHGVRPLMPVIGPKGLVGRVATVGSKASRVLLVTDPNSAVDVLVQRSRARGVVVGMAVRTALRPSYYLTRIEYLRRISDVADGDVVVTSGFDRVFPSGIPVGSVTDIKKERYGIFLEANVVPFENMAELQEVLVLLVTQDLSSRDSVQ